VIDDYSPITVTLASGRVLHVDLLQIEARCLPLDARAYAETGLPLLAKRPVMDGLENAWYESGPVHYLIEDSEAGSVESANRVLVTALLYSSPIHSEGGFSELLVVTYMNWNATGSFQLALQRVLSELDWEALAVDRPLHTKL